MAKKTKILIGVACLLLVAAGALAALMLLREEPVPDWRNRTQDSLINHLGKSPALKPNQLPPGDTLTHIRINKDIRNYSELFEYDPEGAPREPAQMRGIDAADSLKRAFDVRTPLVKIATCDAYWLDSLTHSMPYLVPKAAVLLEDIGCAFADSVTARGGPPYRIIVTSVLRTPYTVSKLLKVNNNAVQTSTHCYGTTFDLSWLRYHCDAPGHTLEPAELKNVLAEILLKFREQRRCNIVYEEGQSCFHITVW